MLAALLLRHRVVGPSVHGATMSLLILSLRVIAHSHLRIILLVVVRIVTQSLVALLC